MNDRGGFPLTFSLSHVKINDCATVGVTRTHLLLPLAIYLSTVFHLSRSVSIRELLFLLQVCCQCVCVYMCVYVCMVWCIHTCIHMCAHGYCLFFFLMTRSTIGTERECFQFLSWKSQFNVNWIEEEGKNAINSDSDAVLKGGEHGEDKNQP